MIKRIELTRFKKYKKESFELTPQGITLLTGGNNAGKSTLIHAISVWEFCKVILLHEKGRETFNEKNLGKGEGWGMSAEEFLPIAVPSLNHLWTNLKTQLSDREKESWPDKYTGYILRIKCIWDYEDQSDRMVEIGLSLVNDRLFIRVTNSNLVDGDHLISTVYLPTFAGVLPKENKVTVAERRAVLGRGMAGSIIRNMIYDLYLEEQKIRKQLYGERTRLRSLEKEKLVEMSPLQHLQNNLRRTFCSELEIEPFSEDFHTMLRISERRVKKVDGKYEVIPKSEYTPRDIITQGSGYLQWLSIFCVLYTSDIDVILLDEPDAHLHAILQSDLLKQLTNELVKHPEKQILISTHSVEIIKQAPLDIVYSMEKKNYLEEEDSRVAVLSGIGSEYFPDLDLLKRYKRLIFLENESDRKILSILGNICGISLPKDVVYWTNVESHQHRRIIFEQLRKIIPDLRCVSLRDRDMDGISEIGSGLGYKRIKVDSDSPILFLEWRRKNIESYLLCPDAIARAIDTSTEEIKKHLRLKFALAIDDDGYIEAEPPRLVLECDGKYIFCKKTDGLEYAYHCTKYDVAKNMKPEQICADIKTFLTRVRNLFLV